MRLTIRLLGTEVLHLSTEPDEQPDSGDVTTYPVGFTTQHGDQRWEQPIREE